MPLPAVITSGQQLPAPSAEALAELAAVQEVKREAFETGATGWVTWNSAYTMNTTVSTTTPVMIEPAWGAWNFTFTSTSGSTVVYDAGSNTAILSGNSITINGVPQWTYWNTGYQETEDQRAEREERVRAENERRAREQEERNAVRAQARGRSLELLRSLLTDAQWASYQEKGWFEVRGRSGRRWRVRDNGQAGNVDLMPEIGEERDVTYCAHPPEGLPDADAHAAQMLALVTDDEAFVRTANVHYRRPGAVPPFMRAVA